MFKTKRTLWVIETQTRHVCLLWTGYDVFLLFSQVTSGITSLGKIHINILMKTFIASALGSYYAYATGVSLF